MEIANHYVVEISKLCKAYKKGAHVLNGVDLKIKEGEIVGLVGPNGAGKTTLFRLLGGLLKPDRGSVKLWGIDPYPDNQEAVSVRKRLCLLWEEITLDPHLTGIENINFSLKIYSLPQDSTETKQLLHQYLLEEVGGNKISTYSQGMKRKLELASAILRKPPLLVVDELGASLDIVAVLQTISLLKELNQKEGTTIIASSHNLRILEKLCQRFIFINKGRIVKDIKISELAHSHVFSLIFASVEDKQKALSVLLEFEVVAFETDPMVIKLVLKEKTELSPILNRLKQQGLKLMDHFEESKLEQLFFS